MAVFAPFSSKSMPSASTVVPSQSMTGLGAARPNMHMRLGPPCAVGGVGAAGAVTACSPFVPFPLEM